MGTASDFPRATLALPAGVFPSLVADDTCSATSGMSHSEAFRDLLFAHIGVDL